MNKLFITLIVICTFILTFSIFVLARTFPTSEQSSISVRSTQTCGLGTKEDNGTCIPDEQQIAEILINSKFIQYDTKKQDIVFVPSYQYEDTNRQQQPKWYSVWLENNEKRLITNGLCNIPGNNCKAPCSCADCAGWRGGNTTDCDQKDLGLPGRVFCNLNPQNDSILEFNDPDMCECKNGYTAVNGLCVSPYKFSDNCCPACASVSPLLGGCAGTTRCDPNKTCTEQTVETPGGDQFPPLELLVTLPHPNILVVDNQCSPTNTDSCWSPDNSDHRKTSPHIIIKTSPTQPLSSLAAPTTHRVNGENEYQCAFKCGDTQGLYTDDRRASTQLECSKMCLPHLWLWYPVFEDNGQSLQFRGYHQSSQLVQYMSQQIQLTYCGSSDCFTEINTNPDFTKLNNCTNCTNCSFKYSNLLNNNGFREKQYTCEKCDICYFEDNLTCKNVSSCSNCQYTPEDLAILGFPQYNTCNSCTQPAADSCRVYTQNPYLDNGTFRQGATTYNKGQQYDPSTRKSGCDYGVVSGNPTCQNNLPSGIGFGDGAFRSVLDCTKSC